MPEGCSNPGGPVEHCSSTRPLAPSAIEEEKDDGEEGGASNLALRFPFRGRVLDDETVSVRSRIATFATRVAASSALNVHGFHKCFGIRHFATKTPNLGFLYEITGVAEP